MTKGNAQGSPGAADQTAVAKNPPSKSSGARLSPGDRNRLGIYFTCLTVLTFYILIATWPAIDPNLPIRLNQPWILGFHLKATADERLFITVAAAGALGSLIHTITSFADYVGNRELTQSWVWYLVLRTPMGIALALLFCIVLRAGLIAPAPSLPEDFAATHPLSLLNPYGFAAIGALAGMFSRQATDKLREVFDTLFKVSQPVDRADPLSPASPVISKMDPTALTVGGATELAVIGRNFIKDCTASINGKQREVKWESDTRVTVALLPEDVSAPGRLQVIVRNPAVVGGASPPFPVTVAPSG
jgi:hypothetical protein